MNGGDGMKKIEKRISFILAIVLLFNFAVPSLALAGISAQGSDTVTGVVDLERGESAQRTISGKRYNFTVPAAGLYTIQVNGRYIIKKLSGGNNTLAAATYVDENGSYNHPELQNGTTHTVSVYLEPGMSYCILPEDESSSFAVSVKRQDVDTDKIYELKSTDDDGHDDYGALKYTYYGSESNPSGMYVAYQLGDSRRISEEDAQIESTSTNFGADESGETSTIQKVMVWLIIYGICDTFKNLISLFVGSVSIDKLLFNTYADTKLSFYAENSKVDPNPLFTEGSGIKSVINSYFDAFRGIAYIFYMIILLYVGIRIVISATGREREKYKSLLTSWGVGLLILTAFPVIIKHAILLNESLVGLLDTNVRSKMTSASTGVFPEVRDVDEAMLEAMGEDTSDPNDLMAYYRQMALDDYDLGYAFIYLFLLKELIAYLFIYYKRMIIIVFLIVLFPFVAISYVFDKVKDGQAQIFNAWFRELLLNIFTQFFHAILYCAIMFIIIALKTDSGGANIILIMVGLGYLRKGDSLLHAIFPTLLKGGGAGTTKDLAETAKSMVKIQAASQIMKSAKNMGNRIGHAKNKVADLRDKAYEHRANQNIDNENRRAVRLEAGRKRDAKDPAKLKLNFEKATGGINVLPEEERANLTPEEAEKRDLEIKREGLNNLNYAKSSKDPAVQKAYQEFMDGLRPREKARLEKRMEASEAINMLVTKKGRDGVELTEEQLNIQAKIVYDITQGGEDSALYGDLYKWMGTKEIATGEKETLYRSKKTGELVSKEEKIERERNGEKFVSVEVDKKQKLTEYFGMTTDADGKQVVGAGLKGRVLTTNASRQKERLDKVFHESVVTKPDGTQIPAGHTMSKDEKEALLSKEENKKKIQAMVSKFGAGASEEEKAEIREMAGIAIILGEYQKDGAPQMSAKSALDMSRRMLDISKNNKGAKSLMDNVIVGETASSEDIPPRVSVSTEPRAEGVGAPGTRTDILGAPVTGPETRTPPVAGSEGRDALGTESRRRIRADSSDEIPVTPMDTTARTGMASIVRESIGESRTGTARPLDVSSSTGSPRRRKSTVTPETDSLGVPRGPESPTEGLSDIVGGIEDPPRTRETAVTEEVIEVTTDDLSEMRLNLGFSIEGLARKAAKEVIKQNGVLANADRTKYTEMALDTLREDTDDELALSETYDSDLDDLISGYREVDEDGFIEETGKTQEEVMQDQYEDRVRQTQTWYADGTLRKSRGKFARATGEAMGAVASATAGNAYKLAAGITTASFTSGLQREGTAQNALITGAVGMSAEDTVERAVIGTYNSETKVDKHKKPVKTLGQREASGVEKVFSAHRKASENVDRRQYVDRGRAAEAQGRINAFSEKISDVKKNN